MPTPTDPRRFALAIETSNPTAAEPAGPQPGAALGLLTPAGCEALGAEPLRPQGPHHDDLLPAIDRLCRAHGVLPAQLARVCVSVGPGGYTALRIAVATAKALAEALGAQTVAVPSTHVAARAHASDAPFAVALASKHDAAWIQPFAPRRADGPVAPLREGALATAADLPALAALGVRTLLADRYLPEPLLAAARAQGWTIRPLALDPAACLALGAAAAPVDPLALAPLYAREPEAVTKWRARPRPAP